MKKMIVMDNTHDVKLVDNERQANEYIITVLRNMNDVQKFFSYGFVPDRHERVTGIIEMGWLTVEQADSDLRYSYKLTLNPIENNSFVYMEEA